MIPSRSKFRVFPLLYRLLMNSFCFHIYLLRMVDANFIFILVFFSLLSFSLASIRLFHFTHGYFILCFLLSTSCSSHTVNTFFPKFMHPELGSQFCSKYTLTEPPAPNMHVHTPSTANAFWSRNIEDCSRYSNYAMKYTNS